MKYVWIATLIAAAALIGALGCIARSYYVQRPDDIWGWITVWIALVILALVMAAAAGILYLFATTHFS